MIVAAIFAAVLAAAPQPAQPPAAAPSAEPSADAPVAVTTRLVPDPSHVGDLLTLEVTAAFPRGYTVNLPIGVKLEPLHLVDVVESEPEATGEGLRKSFTIRLQHFAPGTAEVPGFQLTYVDPQGAIQTIGVPPVAFTIDALLANEAEPQRKPEDPPISIEYPNTLAETIIYSVIGTLVAALLLVLLLRRFFARRRVPIEIPAIPAHIVAFEALEELERSTLLADGRVQDYYVQLTEIGKGYVERRFGVPALDRTTDEIRSELVRHPDVVAPLGAADIIGFLDHSDLVKFARMRPADDEAKDTLGVVRQLVERSVLASTPEPSEPPANSPPSSDSAPAAHDKEAS